MNLFSKRTTYRPFHYPWAYNYYKKQTKIHWIPEEVPMHEDVKDWNTRLSTQEKNLLTQIFRFFTQGDVDVASAYRTLFGPHLHHPEVAMMLQQFGGMEAIHIDAYATLIDTIGMPESEYQAFLDYSEMADKHDYLAECQRNLERWNNDEIKFLNAKPNAWMQDFARCLATFSAFTEGLQLFSSFAILMNFPRMGKMKGMGQIVTWSIRDESLHVEGMIRLFHQLIEENPSILSEEFKLELYGVCRKMVELEDSFIDLAFEQGGIEGLTPDEVKQYVRYIADRRLQQLGLNPTYLIDNNPLPWLESLINAPEHANFFEQRATEYSKGSLKGDIDDDDWS